jgi:hypothetical protein
MFFKEYKTVSPYFGVSKRSKNFFRIRKKKEVSMKKNSQQKNCVPFFGILTFGGLFSLRKIPFKPTACKGTKNAFKSRKTTSV